MEKKEKLIRILRKILFTIQEDMAACFHASSD
jgi:hypothetical protein